MLRTVRLVVVVALMAGFAAVAGVPAAHALSDVPAPGVAATRLGLVPVSGPDFNGDGYADYAVGSVFDDVGHFLNCGAVSVIYGGPTGLDPNAALPHPDDQFFIQGRGGVSDRCGVGENYGFVTEPNDYNNDGFDDLAIEIELENVNGVAFAGAVNVIYGGPNGLDPNPGTNHPDDQFWTQNSPGIIDQAEDRDGFGRALASGDFNCDGVADLAAGDRGEGVPDPSDPKGPEILGAGAVNVIYGQQGVGLKAQGNQFFYQGHDGVPGTAEQKDYFGRSVGAGDFNHDACSDLVVGAYLDDDSGVPNAGSAAVIYGSPGGLDPTGAGGTKPVAQLFLQGQGGVPDNAGPDNHFGRSFGSADFNLDTFDDLAIAARTEPVNGRSKAGAVVVIYGSPTGLSTGEELGHPAAQFWTQDSPGILGQAETGDWFGTNFGSGDFNGDGVPDLAIGVRHEKLGTLNQAGAMNVLFGVAGMGLQADAPDDQFRTLQAAGGAAPHAGDNYGYSPEAGDFNDDGFADLATGIPFGDVLKPSGSTIVDAGAVSVVYGSATGLQSTSPASQYFAEGLNGVQDSAETGDSLGWKGA